MFIPSAYAQTAGAAPDATASMISTFLPLILVFVAFYFLMIRPQQKRAKDMRNAIDALKKNDQVITSGGILGKVTKPGDVYVEVEIAQGVKVQIAKSAIAEIVSPTTAKPAND